MDELHQAIQVAVGPVQPGRRALVELHPGLLKLASSMICTRRVPGRSEVII